MITKSNNLVATDLDKVVKHNNETNTTELGGNVEVDGYIQQNTPNYELDLRNSLIAGVGYTDCFESDTFFTSFKVINGVLWFILSGKAITKAVTSGNKHFIFSIPNKFKELYYSSIYRGDGTPLTEEAIDTSHTGLNICGETSIINVNGAVYSFNIVLQSQQVANGDISIQLYDSKSWTQDGNVWFDIRMPILLI